MFENATIQLHGKSWTLDYSANPSMGVAAKWYWTDKDNMTAPGQVKRLLDAQFLKLWDADKVLQATTEQRNALTTLLPQMGADDTTLKQLGLLERSPEEQLEEERRTRFADLPETGHSPVNCAELLEYFKPTQTAFTGIECVFIGDGPFPRGQLLTLAQQCRFDCSFGNGEESTLGLDDANQFIMHNLFNKVVYVLGRETWNSSLLDQIIDRLEGHSLKFYSQEMFATWVLTGKDPFDAGIDVLSAFRAGHPALAYLSQGWPGWVNAKVTQSRGHGRSATVLEITRESGLLSHFGYHVGNSGEPTSKRQQILKSVFEKDLTELEDRADVDYLSEWGDPRSGPRLKKMAESIAAFCRSHESRRETYGLAIEDWETDLQWLQGTYYHGVMQFAWPGTGIG